jgi:hypothetical protein
VTSHSVLSYPLRRRRRQRRKMTERRVGELLTVEAR